VCECTTLYHCNDGPICDYTFSVIFTKYSRTRFLWQVVFAFPFVVVNIVEALATIPLFIFISAPRMCVVATVLILVRLRLF
jgi:hypothetical protein